MRGLPVSIRKQYVNNLLGRKNSNYLSDTLLQGWYTNSNSSVCGGRRLHRSMMTVAPQRRGVEGREDPNENFVRFNT